MKEKENSKKDLLKHLVKEYFSNAVYMSATEEKNILNEIYKLRKEVKCIYFWFNIPTATPNLLMVHRLRRSTKEKHVASRI